VPHFSFASGNMPSPLCFSENVYRKCCAKIVVPELLCQKRFKHPYPLEVCTKTFPLERRYTRFPMTNKNRSWLALSCFIALGMGAIGSQAQAADLAPPEIEGEAVYVPFPVQIKLDGKTSDWAGVPVQNVARGPALSKDPAENGSFGYSLASDKENLYILMTSVDKNLISGKHGGDLWNEDSLEFYLNPTSNFGAKGYTSSMVQVSFSPADIGNTDPTKPRHFGQGYANIDLKGFVFKTDNGWGFEASVPLAKLNLKAAHGLEIGFQAQSNGASEADRNVKLIWSKADKSDSSYQNPSLFGRALFYEVGNANIPQPSAVVAAPVAAMIKPAIMIKEPAASVKTGQYRNLFAELGKSQAEIDAKIDGIWNQFINGDESQKLFYTVGDKEAYIYAVDSNDVRSEGQSYGMMIAVQLDKKTEFDKIWTWTKNHMEFKDGDHKGYFCWSVRPDGTKNCGSNASDGEAWLVTALFMASARWGNGTGIYDYRAQAQAILDTARSKDAQGGDATDLFNRKNNLITFVANKDASGYTDPSYMVPAFLELWAVAADKDRSFWKRAATAARAFWQTTVNTTTGLMPDYANFDGSPKSVSFNTGANNYLYDARRIHMNIAIDWAWFKLDSWEQAQSARAIDFFYNEGVNSHGSTYKLTGERIGSNNEAGHTAMLATATLALPSDNLKGWTFVDSLWNRPIPTGKYRYYDGLLYMLGMLNNSGKFRYYAPKRY
jgi:oligosaccharide reducing-end xylanase